jgi:hypothetical protein
MPKPVLTRPKKTNLPEPIAPPQAEIPTAKDMAIRAVDDYTYKAQQLESMKEDWRREFSDASREFDSILMQEDAVKEAINKAKPLVAEAKESIGPFVCTLKKSKPCYDTDLVVKILLECEECGKAMEDLLKAGVMTSIVLDNDATVRFMARNKDWGEIFQSAWKESQDLTPAVKVPKV